MSGDLHEAMRRLNADLTVADREVAAWPKLASSVRTRGALLADLARAAEAAGTELIAVAVAARIAAEADAARAAELAVFHQPPNSTTGHLGRADLEAS